MSLSSSVSSSTTATPAAVRPKRRPPVVIRYPDTTVDAATGQSATCDECCRAKLVANVPMCGPVSLRSPERVLVPGVRYLWCSCGQSSTDVFCDGRSCAEGFRALPFEVTVEQASWSLCACRYTRFPPLCDGFHALMDPNPTKPPCDCAPAAVAPQ